MGSAFWRWARRAAAALLLLGVGYTAFLVAGFIPRVGSHSPPAADDTVRIFVRSNEIHTDLVLPVCDAAETIDWRSVFPPDDFRRNVQSHAWISLGWGNRQFYVETPTWAEFQLGTACRALLWPSESVLHVEYVSECAAGPILREVLISRADYRELASFVEASIGTRNGAGTAQTATDVSYGDADRFYTSSGRYHALNTCNQWTGRGLARAGVPVGIWTPLKAHVFFWLPEEALLTKPALPQ
jgi:uncharacterized protein (TIGR02117 family)